MSAAGESPQPSRPAIALICVDTDGTGKSHALPVGWRDQAILLCEAYPKSDEATLFNLGEVIPHVYVPTPMPTHPGVADVRKWRHQFKQALFRWSECLGALSREAAAGRLDGDRSAWEQPKIGELAICVGELQDFGLKLIGLAASCNVPADPIKHVVAAPLRPHIKLITAAASCADQIQVAFAALKDAGRFNMPIAQSRSSAAPVASWIFGSAFAAFLMVAFFLMPNALPAWKQNIVAFIGSLLAGLFGFFLTGTLVIDAQTNIPFLGRTAIKGGLGIALFLLSLAWWGSPAAPVKVDPGEHRKPAADAPLTLGFENGAIGSITVQL